MSSRFISRGRIDAATGANVDSAQNTPAAKSPPKQDHPEDSQLAKTVEKTPSPPAVDSVAQPVSVVLTARQEEWAAVEKQLEAERQRKAAARRAAQTAGGSGAETSLYDVLQANKAAKQAAFEEQHKLKNQFRPLDEDEVEFLDRLKADAQAAEARVRAETAADLDAFRAAQGGGGGGGGGRSGSSGQEEDERRDGADLLGDTAWGPARKRKRRTDKTAYPNMKRNGSAAETNKRADEVEEAEMTPQKETMAKAKPSTAAKPALGLADYGSDDSSDA
ncbi:hypothetical protein SEPCBS119000_000558 [Sporothrix epigloea]|uniref:FAM192A/Fyv6 N-terminal domain-containing protein n=1 Tax=Sporothrix epigloea TaxID=1892477 RepID=A0ABP0D5T8_9PEZI